jgi:peptide/nickel transport system substrate-binding protein
MQWLYARDLMGFASNPKEASKVVPDLATAPGKANADFTESTYTLRDGLKYDDGTPVKSADIKYALERAFATDVINGDPTRYFLPLPSPIPKAKDDGENYTQHRVSTGPFKITDYNKD